MALDVRELECFLVLSEELHFGRTAERLYLSQSRVSQLLQSLERRIGGPLFERTSRRVALTPLGKEFLTSLRPAYAALERVVENARQYAAAVKGTLRIGFQGAASDEILRAVSAFQSRNPNCLINVCELPLNDPSGGLRRRMIDAAVVLLPVAEDDLVVGPVFSRHPQTLAVSQRHRLAARTSIDAEELAGETLIAYSGPAPGYWRQAQAPTQTPAGALIHRGPEVATLQEGLSLIAADRGAMLICESTAANNHRADITTVPLTGFPDSALALVWRRGEETPSIRAFAEHLS
ncbi:DNA-binding transcriptional LysR family regulator [Kribbella aluminosa]|uniref:DNA-binding transcriptional LysR family regulator n=1 Tax=Kribbella aluminosa TaxID=416017 RepID=A0ABS4UE26_9ACTN|nr:LysR family transcriptional regulator [Kribbella aluminosa]MBP2349904.1 DNA-binding transcriptional LysR family regulator [Kribbella aluminosa]